MCRHTRGILFAALLAVVGFGCLWLLNAVSKPSSDGASIHRTVLLANLLIGVLLASIAAVAVVWIRSWPARILLLLVGVVAVWASMLAGVGAGYRAWQSLPDPPEEAFSDGGPLMFSLVFGWFPGLIVVGVGVLAAWAIRRLIGPRSATGDPRSEPPR